MRGDSKEEPAMERPWAWHPVRTFRFEARGSGGGGECEAPLLDSAAVWERAVSPLCDRASAGLQAGVCALGSLGSQKDEWAMGPGTGSTAFKSMTRMLCSCDPTLEGPAGARRGEAKPGQALAVTAWAMRGDNIVDCLAASAGARGPEAAAPGSPSKRPFVWSTTAARRPSLDASSTVILQLPPVAIERVSVARLQAVSCRSQQDAAWIVNRVRACVAALKLQAPMVHTPREREAMLRTMPSRVHTFFRVSHPSGGGLTMAVLADVGQTQTFEGGDDALRRAVATEAAAATRDGHAVFKSLTLLGAIGEARDAFGDVAKTADGLGSPGSEDGPRSARGLLRDTRFLRCLQSLLDSDAETAVVAFPGCGSAAADGLVARQLAAAGRIRTACQVADESELARLRARAASQQATPSVEHQRLRTGSGDGVRHDSPSLGAARGSAPSPRLNPAPQGMAGRASTLATTTPPAPRESVPAQPATSAMLVREANVLLGRAVEAMRRAKQEIELPHNGQRWGSALQDAIASVQPATTILTALLCSPSKEGAAQTVRPGSSQVPSGAGEASLLGASPRWRGTGPIGGVARSGHAGASPGNTSTPGRPRCEQAMSWASDEVSVVVSSTAGASQGSNRRVSRDSSKPAVPPQSWSPAVASTLRSHLLFDSPPTAQALSPVFPPEPWTPDSSSPVRTPEPSDHGGAEETAELGSPQRSGRFNIEQTPDSHPAPRAKRDAPQSRPQVAAPEPPRLASPPVASWFAFNTSERSLPRARDLRPTGTPTTRP